MVASGARPVLAGRDRGRLNALAAQLARTGEGIELETAVAGIVVSERTAARVTSFELDGKTRQAFSIGSSEHFALPRLRPGAAGAAGSLAQAPLTEVGVYLGWFGAATRLVHYAAALATPLSRLPGVHRALDQRAHRIQRNRAGPGTQAAIRSDVVAVAGDASGRNLAVAHLAGGDPYSFTAPVLAWAASAAPRRACSQRARSARSRLSGLTPWGVPAATRDFIARR
jgi:hypothetical protein